MSSTPPRLGIVCPVRGEASYLIEWIAYHRALGIKVFLIADNGGPDNTSDILQDLHARHIIFQFDWRDKTTIQMPFYYQALAAARLGQLDGLFFIDMENFCDRKSDNRFQRLPGAGLPTQRSAPWQSIGPSIDPPGATSPATVW
jgi:hypothetical protein